jgi:hypothetical protein
MRPRAPVRNATSLLALVRERKMGMASGGGLATRVKVAGVGGKCGIIPEGREAQRIILEGRVAYGCPKANGGGAKSGGGTSGGGVERRGARRRRAVVRAAVPWGIENKVLRRRIGGMVGGALALRGGGARAGVAGGRQHQHLRRSGCATWRRGRQAAATWRRRWGTG